MSESDTASVECPLCDEAFDPTAAGGWCTNSECGEWQYESDDTPDQRPATEENRSNDDAATSGDNGGSLDDVNDGSDQSEPPERVEESASAGADRDEAGAEDSDGTDGPAREAEKAAAKGDEAAAANGESIAGSHEGDAEDDGDATEAADPAAEPTESSTGEDSTGGESLTEQGSGDGGDEETTFDCPGCGSALAVAVNFCPDCGEDVSEFPGGDELDACPACGGDVDADDNFCAHCGEDLDAHRGGSDSLSECPDCGADVDEDDSFCAGCGADLDAHRAGETPGAGSRSGGSAASATGSAGSAGASEPAPDALALTAHGKSVVVGDGDVVGREIRSLLTDAGRPEDEAVRVHREHVRFVRESGQFHVVALGQNPTRVRGTSLAQGERERIAPGDELELSDVVTLDVEAA